MGAHGSTVLGALGGAVQEEGAKVVALEVNDVKNLHARFSELHCCPGIELETFTAIFEPCFGAQCGKVFEVFDVSPQNGKVDVHEVFACCIVCCSAFTGARIRILFELYDLNGSNDLTGDEIVIMLRSILRGLCKLTRGAEPELEVLEAICGQIMSDVDTTPDRKVSYTEWLAFCRKEPVVKRLLDMFDSAKLKRSRKIRGSGAAPAAAAAADARDGGGSVASSITRMDGDGEGSVEGGGSKASSPRRGQRTVVRSTMMKVDKDMQRDVLLLKEVYDAMDKRGTSEVHLVDVRRALESQPNISQHVTAMFLTLDTTHKGKVTFRDLLKVLYGKASNEDINTMLHWVARRPKPPPKPIEKPALTREQRDEMLAMFALYDKNTDGALTIKELAAAMAETHALEPHDIERIFVDVGKGRTESISSEEFVSLFSDFIIGDVGMHDIMRGGQHPRRKSKKPHPETLAGED